MWPAPTCQRVVAERSVGFCSAKTRCESECTISLHALSRSERRQRMRQLLIHLPLTVTSRPGSAAAVQAHRREPATEPRRDPAWFASSLFRAVATLLDVIAQGGNTRPVTAFGIPRARLAIRQSAQLAHVISPVPDTGFAGPRVRPRHHGTRRAPQPQSRLPDERASPIRCRACQPAYDRELIEQHGTPTYV